MSSEPKKPRHEDGNKQESKVRAKRGKVSGHTFPLSVKFWVLKNYEYDPANCYYRLADVMAHLQSDEEMSQQNGGKPLSHCQARLRPIIRDFWDGKVFFTNCRFQRGGKRVRALKHLRRKDLNSAVKPESENSASKHVIVVPGWQVVINNDNSLSLLRVEDWLLDQQRVITEIRADQREDSSQYICSISSHGRILDPKQMGLKLGQMANPKEELELLAKCMSASKLCKGFLFGDSGVPSCSELRVAEYSTASDPSMSETRAFSSKCQVVCSSRSTCLDCIKCKQSVRKRKQLGKLNAKANHRFMNREQLVSKLKEVQKELQSCRQKIRRLEYGEGADEQKESDEDHVNDDGDTSFDVSNDAEDKSNGSNDDDEDNNDSGNNGSDDDDDENSDGSDDDKDENNDTNTNVDVKREGDNNNDD